MENSHNSLISCPLACTKTPKSPDLGRRRHPPLVKENFYQYQEHLKFVCILFSSTLNNFRSQITGVSDQSAPWLVLETQECYATLWYSTSIFQFNNHLTCTRTPGERRKEGGREGGRIKKWIAGISAFFTFFSKRLTGVSANPNPGFYNNRTSRWHTQPASRPPSEAWSPNTCHRNREQGDAFHVLSKEPSTGTPVIKMNAVHLPNVTFMVLHDHFIISTGCAVLCH